MASSSDSDSNDSGTFKQFVEEYSEEELGTILIVGGFILFIFPEPITSVIGVIVLFLGAVTWFSDWLWG
jgi:hypothetical protein